jgi:hypothetical protein
MRAPCRDAMRPDLRRDGAPRSAKSLWLVPCGTQAPRGAPHALMQQSGKRMLAATGPALVRSVAHLCADRAFSQLLAGTPIGPGGSPDAARVPRCDEARGRRTSSSRSDDDNFPRPAFFAPRIRSISANVAINEGWLNVYRHICRPSAQFV